MAKSGPGSGSDLYESKNLANFLMRFLIRMGVPSLMLIFLDSPHLEQCGSAAPLWKFHHSSQSQESDRLFLKDFGNSWTSQEEGPLHCLHRGQGQNHESGLWFRDWSLNNLEEFVLGVLVLAYGNYFLGFISYIDEVFEQYSSQWIKNIWPSLGQSTWGFALSSDCYLSLGPCFMILGWQGPFFMGGEMIITNADRDNSL